MAESFEKTGMDRSLPHIGVIMEKHDTHNYPVFSLPNGFRFSFYLPGFEKQWAELQTAVGNADSYTEALDAFFTEFLQGDGFDWVSGNNRIAKNLDISEYSYFGEMCHRVIFVVDQDGKVAGTGALWKGNIFGPELQRLHWIAVKPCYQGLGISKAILTKLLNLYNDFGYAGYLYLTSQTWSYKALNIYCQFGFKPYWGEKPANWVSVNLMSPGREPWDYQEKNHEAWNLIYSKIAEYERQKEKRSRTIETIDNYDNFIPLV